nr:putative porin [uncultured Desulfobacter sp.]
MKKMTQHNKNKKESFRIVPAAAICCLLVGLLWAVFVLPAMAKAETIPNGSFDTTEALIQLLKEKGVINDKEASGFLDRHRKKATSTGQTITISSPGDQEAYLQQLSKDATQKVTNDLNNLKENYEYRSQDLIKKNILLEREVARLEEIITEEQMPALQKSSWAQRIKFGGDIRVRHESVMYDPDNATDIMDVNDPGTNHNINTTHDQHRQRVRLRFGVKANLIDQTEKNVGKVEAGMRVATGSVGNPVSTNHTLGDASNDRSDIVLDRAYVNWKYKPREEIWGGKLPQISLTGGIMENPWLSSNLIWDSDLGFEGVALNFVTDTLESNPFKAFVTMGYFPLEESEWSQDDKFMLGGQIGFSHRPWYGWEYKLAAAYYDYNNVSGQAVTGYQTTATRRLVESMSPKYMQGGNSTFTMDQTTLGTGEERQEDLGLLAEFRLLSLSARLVNSLYFPIQVQLYADWVKNLAYDAQAMSDKLGGLYSKEEIEADSGDTGYQVGVKVGYLKPRERGEWNVSLEYRYLESDAVLDAYTDSDFHLGGTNAQGWIVGLELGLYHNLWLKARWMTSDEITNMENSDDQNSDLSVDTLQIDLNAAF